MRQFAHCTGYSSKAAYKSIIFCCEHCLGDIRDNIVSLSLRLYIVIIIFQYNFFFYCSYTRRNL